MYENSLKNTTKSRGIPRIIKKDIYLRYIVIKHTYICCHNVNIPILSDNTFNFMKSSKLNYAICGQ